MSAPSNANNMETIKLEEQPQSRSQMDAANAPADQQASVCLVLAGIESRRANKIKTETSAKSDKKPSLWMRGGGVIGDW